MKHLILSVLLLLTSACSHSSSIKNILLTPDNTVTLRTAVSEDSMDYIIRELINLDKRLPSDEPIYLVLDTPGGSVFAGARLIEYIRGLKREVKTITMHAASMGFMIVQAAGERLVLGTGLLMSHPVASGCEGNLYQLRSCMQLVESLSNMMDDIASKRIGMTREKYQEWISHDRYLMGQDMILFNTADRFVTIACSQLLIDKRIEIETPTIASMIFGGAPKVELISACPLIKESFEKAEEPKPLVTPDGTK